MNFYDRIRITRDPPSAPEATVYASVPCRFSFLESIKNEQLMGAQTAQASFMIPKSFPVVTSGVDIAEYKFYLLSPNDAGNLVDYAIPSTEKYTRLFRYFICQVFQHGQIPE